MRDRAGGPRPSSGPSETLRGTATLHCSAQLRRPPPEARCPACPACPGRRGRPRGQGLWTASERSRVGGGPRAPCAQPHSACHSSVLPGPRVQTPPCARLRPLPPRRGPAGSVTHRAPWLPSCRPCGVCPQPSGRQACAPTPYPSAAGRCASSPGPASWPAGPRGRSQSARKPQGG